MGGTMFFIIPSTLIERLIAYKAQITSYRDVCVQNLTNGTTDFLGAPSVSILSPIELVETAIRESERFGYPLVITDFDKTPEWPADKFNMRWLLRYSKKRT